MLPPPLLATAVAGRKAAATVCLHGEALGKALQQADGFERVVGRKPGLRATRAGALARLRVRLTAGEHGNEKTHVHLGYLRRCGHARLTHMHGSGRSKIAILSEDLGWAPTHAGRGRRTLPVYPMQWQLEVGHGCCQRHL